jgi:serine/threonine-protein kinase
MAPAGSLPSGTVLGDFEIERPLSAGGMGAVYVAVQRSTGKRRALKVMRPELVADERNRRRFVEEARIGSRIDSAHVVEVVGAGVDEATGVPWLAMELLEGHDLSEHVERRGPISFAELLDLYDQLAHALGRAHDVGVIHRDLKPENLFVADSRQRGGRPMLKILDFGIATFVAEDETAATVTSAIGSPLWIAPEQTSTGAKLRACTDVWALGLIAFYLLTGHHYWPAAEARPFNLHALLAEILAAALPKASERAAALGVADRLPVGFDAWFASCVARDPAARYADARSAVQALAMLTPAPSIAPTIALDASARPEPAPIAPLAPTEPLRSPSAPGNRSSDRVAHTEPLQPPARSEPMQTRPPSEHGRSRVLFGGAVALVALVAAVVGIAAYGGDSPAETTRERTSPAQSARRRLRAARARTSSARSGHVGARWPERRAAPRRGRRSPRGPRHPRAGRGANRPARVRRPLRSEDPDRRALPLRRGPRPLGRRGRPRLRDAHQP